MDDKVRQAWEDFLNPDLVRHRLISAALYIAAFESLKDSIVVRIRDFFTHGFDENGDIISPRYKSDVLNNNQNRVLASLFWLKERGAIDETDVAAFERGKSCRNHLAHELYRVLGEHGLPPDFENRFRDMVTLLRKIELWWIVNVEIPINPDLDVNDIDVDGIIPGPVMSLQLLHDIALGSDKQCRFYYDEFLKQSKREDGK